MIPEEPIRAALDAFTIETPSWGYANTGTRFGKFLQDGAAIDFSDKLDDAAEVHRLTGCCPSIAVHVLWDFPPNPSETDIRNATAMARERGLRIGSINPNLFQDQNYKLGSLANPDPEIQTRALRHCLESVRIAQWADSSLVTLWLADGTNYPGQDDIRARKRRLEEALRSVHDALADEQTLLVEYKPFEPAFYHTDIADWGMASHLARTAGPRARVLVDTGHHYAAQNIEQIVAWLLDNGELGGFHFNDRRYADDDLTLGSIDPYQLFRIFHEILSHAADSGPAPIAYMIDQSHNLKPKIEAMIQSVANAQDALARAAAVDRVALRRHQRSGDIVAAERELQKAFRHDITPVIARWRTDRGLPADPLEAYRKSDHAARTAADRRKRRAAQGPAPESAYA